jgi:hypothetical protein
MLVDGFDLGPGRYRVDLQMGGARGWECSAHWEIQTQPKDGLPDQPLTLEPNQIVERIAGPFDDEPSVDHAVGQQLGIKILLNLSPSSSVESILNSLHTSVLMSIVRSITRQPGIGRFTDGLVCMKNGLTYSVPAALLFWLLLRRGAILSPKLIGAVTGGLAGLIGLSVLEVNCPNLNIFHILVWHWGVVLLSSLAGALVGTATEYFDRPRNQMF